MADSLYMECSGYSNSNNASNGANGADMGNSSGNGSEGIIHGATMTYDEYVPRYPSCDHYSLSITTMAMMSVLTSPTLFAISIHTPTPSYSPLPPSHYPHYTLHTAHCRYMMWLKDTYHAIRATRLRAVLHQYKRGLLKHPPAVPPTALSIPLQISKHHLLSARKRTLHSFHDYTQRPWQLLLPTAHSSKALRRVAGKLRECDPLDSQYVSGIDAYVPGSLFL